MELSMAGDPFLHQYLLIAPLQISAAHPHKKVNGNPPPHHKSPYGSFEAPPPRVTQRSGCGRLSVTGAPGPWRWTYRGVGTVAWGQGRAFGPPWIPWGPGPTNAQVPRQGSGGCTWGLAWREIHSDTSTFSLLLCKALQQGSAVKSTASKPNREIRRMHLGRSAPRASGCRGCGYPNHSPCMLER